MWSAQCEPMRWQAAFCSASSHYAGCSELALFWQTAAKTRNNSRIFPGYTEISLPRRRAPSIGGGVLAVAFVAAGRGVDRVGQGHGAERGGSARGRRVAVEGGPLMRSA